MNSVRCKTILIKSKLPKVDYCFNTYIGCTHSCKYCYAEFMKRFTGHMDDEWGKFIDYKENAIDVLEKEIKKIEKGKWVLLGSVTDAYQPVEKKTRLTRRSLEVFLRNQIPVSLLTKSDLVTRDIDLFSQFKNCEVGISCGIIDEKAAAVLEPHASSPCQRLAALKKLKKAGIKTYLFLGPIIPHLTNIDSIFSAAGNDVDFIMAEALNLKCGNPKQLKSTLLALAGEKKSDEIYKSCRSREYWLNAENKFNNLCAVYKIENRGFFKHNNV